MLNVLISAGFQSAVVRWGWYNTRPVFIVLSSTTCIISTKAVRIGPAHVIPTMTFSNIHKKLLICYLLKIFLKPGGRIKYQNVTASHDVGLDFLLSNRMLYK